MEGLHEAIRAKVCANCIDANADGKCTLPTESRCPVELYAPLIVQTIATVKSEDYPAYVAALRLEVCLPCKYGTPESCAMRDVVDCPLDRYYPMVIDAVEDFLATLDGEPAETTPAA